MPPSTLQAIGVEKSFASGSIVAPVLSGLSLEIQAGKLTLIEGPSGCGKSTLLALLSGMLRPDAGRIIALGVPLERCGSDELDRFRLRHTGFVFQSFNLFPSLTAIEQVLLPLQHMQVAPGVGRKRAWRALQEVGLGDHVDSYPNALSGGQKQRVAIARALAKRPELLFADEPTSALDAANGQSIIDLLHRIARTHGSTVVCASHDPRLARHADRVLRMEDGRIVEELPRGHDSTSERTRDLCFS